ncbi:MAG: hypothetical protein HW388_1544 [Dehalococcoidia bacterium]|nr:hypothetical protein [Dehalococcoidia bacterium]
MAKALAAFRRRLPGVKPWVAVAALLAAVLLVYYTVLAARYWEGSRQVTSLDNRVQQLSAQIRNQPPDEGALEAMLLSQEQRLEELRSSFSDPDTDNPMALLSNTAMETGVALVSVTAGEVSSEDRNGAEHPTLPMTLTLRGATPQLYQFLRLLHQRAPAMGVSSFRMSGLDGTPSAQVQLLFYLLSRATPERKAP